ncbi:MAG: VOC family protein [Nanoarchaeota archaeon]|nr:VOC family protein [Nanoarchaeota archaeon]MBU0977522.1 VOC family protein [Nanoarchaeota archaeon]
MNNLDEFYTSAGEIVKVFDNFVKGNDLTDKAKADHVCYKCGSTKSFEAMRRMFEQGTVSRWAYQSIIAKRRIALFRLRRPIETSLGVVNILELSDQKPDNSQSEGFDHIEVYHVSGDYDRLVVHLKDRGASVKEVIRPHHTTHDIPMCSGYLLRLTREGLVGKIQREMIEG